MNAERGEKTTEEKFEASTGWFMMFQKRSHLHSIKDKAGSTDAEATAHYPKYLVKIINEGGYIK